MDLFQLLDARGIGYCVVGDTSQLPQRVASDVDIVVAQSVVTQIPKLLDEYCGLRGLHLVQCLQHESNAYYFVVAFKCADQRQRFLALDFCGDYFRRGRQFLPANEILASAIPAVDADGNSKGFSVCAPAIEFSYYLLKKIDKEQLDQSHRDHLTRHWQRDPAGSARMIERYWGRSLETRLLTRAAASGDWSTVAKLLPRMRAALHRRLPLHVGTMLLEVTRRWRRLQHPTGLFVASLGPDGSGKSSVIAAVDRQLREAFRQTVIVHLRPGFLYRPARAASRTPQAERPRGRLRSFLKLLFFAADYILGYVFYLRPLLVRSTGLLFDRYYDDLLVDPLRYRQRGSMAFARLLRAVIPRPDLWLLFDAPAEILQARKQEVPFAESERQRRRYREVLNDQQSVTVLDASQPLDTVIRRATDAVLARCEARTRARLGLPRASGISPATASPSNVSPLSARWLLFCCRHKLPLLSKLTRIAFNSDIYCKVPQDLYLPHPYGIVIHSQTQLGRQVTLMQQVTLGGKDFDRNVAPIIGDGVYIGAGARVLGAVTIGAGAIVGANAVITRDVPAGATAVGANRILTAVPTADSPLAAIDGDNENDTTSEEALEKTEAEVVAITRSSLSRVYSGGIARR